MVAIERILCPVDRSRFAARALRYAVALADWYKSEVTALWVRPPVLAHTWEEQPTAEQAVEAFVRHAVGPGEVRVQVKHGAVADEILRVARDLRADLMVMGSHGLTGYDRLFLGSVTEKLLRKAPCPILTVPRRAGDAPDASPVAFRTIVCAVDFSSPSTRAFEYALSLAQEAGGKLILVHSLEGFSEEEFRIWARFDVPEVRRAREEEARRQLGTLIPDEARTWCDPLLILGQGKAYQLVLRIAAEHKADLIVLGVQGRGAVELTLFGSTTQRVLRDATCPVLAVGTEPSTSPGV